MKLYVRNSAVRRIGNFSCEAIQVAAWGWADQGADNRNKDSELRWFTSLDEHHFGRHRTTTRAFTFDLLHVLAFVLP